MFQQISEGKQKQGVKDNENMKKKVLVVVLMIFYYVPVLFVSKKTGAR